MYCLWYSSGSILGPLLFLLYINDIAHFSNILFATLFADDTKIFLTGKNIHKLLESINVELQKVVIWLNANKLFLNVEKSHFMLFTNMQTNLNDNDKVYINGKVVGQVKSTIRSTY
jgi:hypothetical protein